MKLRVGIIGCGNVAWRYSKIFGDPLAGTHFAAIMRNPLTQLVAVCDQDRNIMDEMQNFCSIPLEKYQEVDDFINTKLDVVSVCADTSAHFEIVMQLLKRGVKNIWLEKPSVLDPDSHKNLLRLAEKYSSRVQVNYQRLFDPGIMRIADTLKAEEIFNINGRFSLELDRNGVHLLSLISEIISLKPNIISKLQYTFGENYLVARYKNFYMTLNEVPCDYHVLECNIYTPCFAVQISDKCTHYQVSKKTKVGGDFCDLVPIYEGNLVPPQELFDRSLSNLISDEKLISPLDTDLLLMSLKDAFV